MHSGVLAAWFPVDTKLPRHSDPLYEMRPCLYILITFAHHLLVVASSVDYLEDPVQRIHNAIVAVSFRE